MTITRVDYCKLPEEQLIKATLNRSLPLAAEAQNLRKVTVSFATSVVCSDLLHSESSALDFELAFIRLRCFVAIVPPRFLPKYLPTAFELQAAGSVCVQKNQDGIASRHLDLISWRLSLHHVTQGFQGPTTIRIHLVLQQVNSACSCTVVTGTSSKSQAAT